MPTARRRRASAPTAARGRRTPVPSASVSQGPPIFTVQAGRSKKICLCLYGEPGIGKTVFVGTTADLPGMNGGKPRVIILRPPLDHTDSIVQKADQIDEWVLHDWAEADDALLYLRNDGADLYDWVWLDSLSLWQDQGLDDIWEKLLLDKPHRKQWGLDKGEYGVNMHRIGVWIRHMVGCPHWHFGVTCHPRITESTEDKEDPQEKLMPWVQGKMMAPKVCGYMNVVGLMRWEEVGGGNKKSTARVLRLNSTKQYYAKDQFTSTDNGRMINPTMPKLVEGIVSSAQYKRESARATGQNSRRTTRRRRPAK